MAQLCIIEVTPPLFFQFWWGGGMDKKNRRGRGCVRPCCRAFFFSSHPAADGWQTHPTYFLLGFSAALASKFTLRLSVFFDVVAQRRIMTSVLFCQLAMAD